jgi:hypothetical protein
MWQDGTMHLLQRGGRYLQGWEQRAWVALLVVLSVALIALLLAGRSLFALPIAVAALVAVPKIVRTLKNVRKGRLGESLSSISSGSSRTTIG